MPALDHVIPVPRAFAAWLKVLMVVTWFGGSTLNPRTAHADTEAPTLAVVSDVPAVTTQPTLRIRGVARDTGVEPLLSQDFETPGEDPVADLGWQLYNGVYANRLVVEDGGLVIEPTGRPWWWAEDEALHLYRLFDGDFAVTLSVSVSEIGGGIDFDPQFAIAGLLARDPNSTSYVQSAFGAAPTSIAPDLIYQTKQALNGVSERRVTNLHPSGAGQTRLCRQGATFHIYYRGSSADPWMLADQIENSELPPVLAVGPFAYDRKNAETLRARFDEISVHLLNSLEGCLTAEQGGGGSGIADVEIAAETLGIVLSAELDPGGNFTIDVPLEPGDNRFVLTALDASGNRSEGEVVEVERQVTAVPTVVIDSPSANHETMGDRIEVVGRVLTSLSATEVSIRLGDLRAIPVPTTGGYSYQFEVPLARGSNVFEVEVFTTYGSHRQDVAVHRLEATETSPDEAVPRIEVPFAMTQVVVDTAMFTVSGLVRSDPCVAGVLVDGLLPDELQSLGPGVASFSSSISLDSNQSYPVMIVATGCNGAESSLTIELVRDDSPPDITITAPAVVNGLVQVVENPLRITGVINEPMLAGALLGGQLLVLEPGAEPGTWRFDARLDLLRGIVTPVAVQAWDQAGLRSTVSFDAQLNRAIDVSIRSPAAGAQLALAAGETETSVNVRVRESAPTDLVFARIDTGPAVPLGAGEGDHRGSVGPLLAGEEQALEVWVEDTSGAVLARSSVSVSVLDRDSLPLTLLRADPPSGASRVESNQPVTLYFSREVDPETLEIEVRETVHGFVYEAARTDADIRTQSSVERVRVDRDRTPVYGHAMNLPGNRSYTFSPDVDWTYGARVEIEVRAGGTSVGRTEFVVRDLPTLVHGFVLDHLQEPIEGIIVALPGLGYETTTDENGLFAFGWGWRADKPMPEGRHLAIVNPGQHNPTYGIVESYLQVSASYVNSVGALQLPRLPTDIQYTELRGGADTALAGGRIVLGLENADLRFATSEGSTETGLVSPMLTSIQSCGYPAQTGLGLFAVRFEPGGIAVEGSLTVDLAMPRREGQFAYLDLLPRIEEEDLFLLLLGLEPKSLSLVPVGILRFDPESQRASTVRPIERLARLDVLAIAVLPFSALKAASDYAAGDVDADALFSVLGAVR